MIDVDDFLKDLQKRKKRSKLEDYYDTLLKLQSEKCTLEVMQEFLKQNDVTVSKGAISKFLKRREDNKLIKQQKEPRNDELTKTENKKQKTFEEIQKEISDYKKANFDE